MSNNAKVGSKRDQESTATHFVSALAVVALVVLAGLLSQLNVPWIPIAVVLVLISATLSIATAAIMYTKRAPHSAAEQEDVLRPPSIEHAELQPRLEGIKVVPIPEMSLARRGYTQQMLTSRLRYRASVIATLALVLASPPLLILVPRTGIYIVLLGVAPLSLVSTLFYVNSWDSYDIRRFGKHTNAIVLMLVTHLATIGVFLYRFAHVITSASLTPLVLISAIFSSFLVISGYALPVRYRINTLNQMSSDDLTFNIHGYSLLTKNQVVLQGLTRLERSSESLDWSDASQEDHEVLHELWQADQTFWALLQLGFGVRRYEYNSILLLSWIPVLVGPTVTVLLLAAIFLFSQ